MSGKWAAFCRGVHTRLALMLLAAGMVLIDAQAAEPPKISEYELKAAILPKLPLFMTWPENAFHDADSPVRIGVLGTNPFGNYLQEAVRGKKVGTRQFSVQACANVEEATRCHLIFISGGTDAEIRGTLRALEGQPVITVGDASGFAEAGGMVALALEDKRVGLHINPAALNAAGLRADPQLLRIARIIKTTPPPAARPPP